MSDQAASVAPQALGYVGIRAKDLGDWASYGSNLLGLQRIDKSRSTLAFRMDDRKQRLLVEADGGEGIGFMGWELADAAALDALAGRLEQAGVEIAHGIYIRFLGAPTNDAILQTAFYEMIAEANGM